ncbi:MAG: hypothetical protein Kow0042_26510 [Calditrichia bacterium]
MRKIVMTGFIVSLALWAFAGAQQFQVPIDVTDGQYGIVLTIGVDPAGTAGYDPGLDVYAPPPPPSGAFDGRLIEPSTNENYITDIRDNSPAEKMFKMKYAAATGFGPIVLHWDATSLTSLGEFIIVDDITGTLFGPLDMKTIDSLVVTDPLITQGLRILVTPAVGIEDPAQLTIPTEFQLLQNYPNPFNPSTEIRFALPLSENVEIAIFNILGQKIKTLLTGKVEAGYHSVVWDGTRDNGALVVSGIYLYRITAGEFQATRRMVLLK